MGRVSDRASKNTSTLSPVSKRETVSPETVTA